MRQAATEGDGADREYGAAAGFELDRADMMLGTPRHALVIASSEGHGGSFVLVPEELLTHLVTLPGEPLQFSGIDRSPNTELKSMGATGIGSSGVWAALISSKDRAGSMSGIGR